MATSENTELATTRVTPAVKAVLQDEARRLDLTDAAYLRVVLSEHAARSPTTPNTKRITDMTTANLPTAWNDVEQLDGLDIVDKGELVGVPFRITGVSFETNARGVSYVYVDGEKADGEGFTFNDSSSGVRAQIVSHLTKSGQDAAIDTGDTLVVSLVIPRGLRVSEYDVKDDYGKAKKARTYYLTTSGRRAAAEPVKAQK